MILRLLRLAVLVVGGGLAAAMGLVPADASAQGLTCPDSGSAVPGSSARTIASLGAAGPCFRDSLPPGNYNDVTTVPFAASFTAILPDGDPDGSNPSTGLRVTFTDGVATRLTISTIICAGATSTSLSGGLGFNISLPDGGSCELSVAADGDTVGFIGATLSRTGSVYALTSGNLIGGIFGGTLSLPSSPSTGSASEETSETFVRTRTMRAISNFIAARADQLIANAPDISQRHSRSEGTGANSGGNFSATGTQDSYALTFSSSLREVLKSGILGPSTKGASRRGELGRLQAFGHQSLSPTRRQSGTEGGVDIWVHGKLSHVDAGDASSRTDLGQLYVGLDYRANETWLWGVLTQFDWSDNDDTSLAIATEGSGWLAGPYAVARLYENVLVDGLLAYGQSDNDVTAAGGTGSFDTDRYYFKAQVTGELQTGRWQVSPHLALKYFEEEQQSFTTSQGTFIPSQSVEIGRVTFGPSISTQLSTDDGTIITPRVALKGIWDFKQAKAVNLVTGSTTNADKLRGRIEFGLTANFSSGWEVTGEGYYDGIGADKFDAYGAGIQISIPWN